MHGEASVAQRFQRAVITSAFAVFLPWRNQTWRVSLAAPTVCLGYVMVGVFAKEIIRLASNPGSGLLFLWAAIAGLTWVSAVALSGRANGAVFFTTVGLAIPLFGVLVHTRLWQDPYWSVPVAARVACEDGRKPHTVVCHPPGVHSLSVSKPGSTAEIYDLYRDQRGRLRRRHWRIDAQPLPTGEGRILSAAKGNGACVMWTDTDAGTFSRACARNRSRSKLQRWREQLLR